MLIFNLQRNESNEDDDDDEDSTFKIELFAEDPSDYEPGTVTGLSHLILQLEIKQHF